MLEHQKNFTLNQRSQHFFSVSSKNKKMTNKIFVIVLCRKADDRELAAAITISTVRRDQKSCFNTFFPLLPDPNKRLYCVKTESKSYRRREKAKSALNQIAAAKQIYVKIKGVWTLPPKPHRNQPLKHVYKQFDEPAIRHLLVRMSNKNKSGTERVLIDFLWEHNIVPPDGPAQREDAFRTMFGQPPFRPSPDHRDYKIWCEKSKLGEVNTSWTCVLNDVWQNWFRHLCDEASRKKKLLTRARRW